MKLDRLTASLRSPIAIWSIAALGLIACGVLIRHAGTALVIDALRRASGFIVLLLVLELSRAGCELLSTRAVLGEHARAVPWPVMLRAHFLAQVVATLMPAGRSLGELSKAALLTPYVGGPRAAAVGASGQIIALFVNGAVGLAGGAIVLAWGSAGTVVALFFGYGAVLTLAATALVVAARSRVLRGALERGDGERAAAFAQAVRSKTALGPRAIAAQCAGRLAQTAQLGVIAYALDVPSGLLAAPLLEAVYIAGSSIGDFIPAQLGSVDGVLALAAPILRVSSANAIALGLTLHAVQITGAALAAVLASLLARSRAAAPVVVNKGEDSGRSDRSSARDDARLRAGHVA